MLNKLLIVDDELDILKSLKIIFEQFNYDVITVDSGEKCLKELEKGFKGVVLIDIMMPGLDGWDTIKEILKRGLMDNIAIDIITGKGTKDHDKMIGLELYIYDYLSKPVEIEELIESVMKCSIQLAKKNKK